MKHIFYLECGRERITIKSRYELLGGKDTRLMSDN
jgi:hypothetical protein